MRVEPHMCRAPVRFGMLATSRIHRSASFFRGFYAIHLPLETAHPSLLSQWLSALLRTSVAYVADHPAPIPPSPYTDGSGSLPPTAKLAPSRYIGLWPPCGDTRHNGNSRAPGTHGEIRPGHVSISTLRHPQSHTAAQCLRESNRPL